MSRVYEALQRSQGDNPNSPLVPDQSELSAGNGPATALADAGPVDANWLNVPARACPATIAHALSSVWLRSAQPEGTGAEMFRVLATRLAHMQKKRRLQKLLITSSGGR